MIQTFPCLAHALSAVRWETPNVSIARKMPSLICRPFLTERATSLAISTSLICDGSLLRPGRRRWIAIRLASLPVSVSKSSRELAASPGLTFRFVMWSPRTAEGSRGASTMAVKHDATAGRPAPREVKISHRRICRGASSCGKRGTEAPHPALFAA